MLVVARKRKRKTLTRKEFLVLLGIRGENLSKKTKDSSERMQWKGVSGVCVHIMAMIKDAGGRHTVASMADVLKWQWQKSMLICKQ